MDGVKVCPHCNNKVGATKQFCPYCNEYIASIPSDNKGKKSFAEFILSTRFLIVSNVIFIILSIILVVILLFKK